MNMLSSHTDRDSAKVKALAEHGKGDQDCECLQAELSGTRSEADDCGASLTISDQPIVRKRLSRKTKIKVILVGIIVAILAVLIILDLAFDGPVTHLLSNRDELVSWIESTGPFGPVIFIVLQILQTVVAPIPGQIVGSVGGFLFGGWGILWTLIGSTIGCWIVFVLARKFGRPLLEKIFKKSVIKKFDFVLEAKSAALILFAVFLLPGLPDDMVCYLAGLTNVPISQLVVLVTLGHLPTIVLTNYLGSGLSDNLFLVVLIGVAAMLVLGLATWQRERIMNFLKRIAKK